MDSDKKPFPTLADWHQDEQITNAVEALGLTVSTLVDEVDTYNRWRLLVVVWRLNNEPFMITYTHGRYGNKTKPAVVTDLCLYLEASTIIHKTLEAKRVLESTDVMIVDPVSKDPSFTKIHQWDIRSDFSAFNYGNW